MAERSLHRGMKVRCFSFEIRGGPYCGEALYLDVSPGEWLPSAGEIHEAKGRVFVLVEWGKVFLADDRGVGPAFDEG